MDENQVIDLVIDGLVSLDSEMIQKVLELIQLLPDVASLLAQGIEAKAKSGDEKAAGALLIIQLVAQASQAQKAAHGAKLQYLKRLLGVCAEDEQMVYFKAGGKVCSKCVKAQKKVKKDYQGNKFFKEGGVTTLVNNFRTDYAYKCGGKIKKGEEGLEAKPNDLKKKTGYMANSKTSNFKKLQSFNRSHPYEDRNVDLSKQERKTQDSLKLEAIKDGSWKIKKHNTGGTAGYAPNWNQKTKSYRTSNGNITVNTDSVYNHKPVNPLPQTFNGVKLYNPGFTQLGNLQLLPAKPKLPITTHPVVTEALGGETPPVKKDATNLNPQQTNVLIQQPIQQPTQNTNSLYNFLMPKFNLTSNGGPSTTFENGTLIVTPNNGNAYRVR